MAYNINKYNGSLLTSISDGTADSTSTNLTLPGPNYIGYGQQLNENLVYLLENFASDTAPIGHNLLGQLWFDTQHQSLNVFTNQGYTPVSGAVISKSQPTSPKNGEFWLNTSTNQLFVCFSGAFNLIGPNYTSSMGTSGAIPLTVEDLNVTGVTHNIIQLQFGNIILAIFSSDSAFSPRSAITGFPVIYPGITINNSLLSGSAQLYTNANTATYLPTDTTITNIISEVEALASALYSIQPTINSTVQAANVSLTSFINYEISTVNTLITDSIQTLNSTANAIIANTNAIASSLTADINQVYSDFVANISIINSGLTGVTAEWKANAVAQQQQINMLVAGAYSNANVANYLPSYNGAISAATITATTPAYNDISNSVATTAYVNSVVPRGVIWMWNSSTNTIPAGWQLCDGSNRTPDLRGQFIIGAGGAYNVGATGGASSFTIGVDNLPSHAHAISLSATTGAAGGHSHSVSSSSTSVVNDPGHFHSSPGKGAPNGGGVSGAFDSFRNPPGYPTTTEFTGITVTTSTSTSLSAVGDHSHLFSVTGTTSSTGSGTSIDNRPPFYALCYIQKMY
jgi:hypothetical protein